MYLSDLPGKEAHIKMAPAPRVITLNTESAPPADARNSAVLVLLFPNNQGLTSRELLEWEVVLIKRNLYDGVHSGQIAFPGGKCEDRDPDPTGTACREFFEELGIKRSSIAIIGQLSQLYVPPSNFIIYPVLAFAKENIVFIPDKREVADFKKIPVKMFNPKNSVECLVKIGNDECVPAPGFIADDYLVWGATAMILSELYQLLDEARVRISFNNP